MSIDTSVVRIRTADHNVVGAGFLVDHQHIFTCAHVVTQALGLPEEMPDAPPADIWLDFPLVAPKKLLTAKVVHWYPKLEDESGDIAVLQLQADLPVGAEEACLAEAEDVWEHPFRTFGFPQGQDDGVWATGRLLGRQATNWIMMEDVKTQGFGVVQGFSGGPVWDTQLQGVVGMVVASVRSTTVDTKAAFVIPFDMLTAIWEIESPMMSQRIFLSSAPDDSTFAEQLRIDLSARGIVVWNEQQGPERVPANKNKEERLQQAIRSAQALVLVVSSRTRTSRIVKEHLRLANLYRRPLILVWVGNNPDTRPYYYGWRETTWIDVHQTPYPSVLEIIETSLSQDRLTSITALLDPINKTRWPEPRNPYKGLRAFTEEDTRDFFGRNRLVNDLLQKVQELLVTPQAVPPQERLLTLIGPSGSGKSSVLMAGLLPGLRSGALPGSEQWIYLEPVMPGKHPLEALALALKPYFPDSSIKTLREDVEDDAARGLHLLATQLAPKRETRVVLLVDQFEELFTQTESEAERQQFIEVLLTAATEPRGPVLVLLTLRADFYDRPMRYPSLSRAIQAHQQQLLPMEVEDLRATIEQPAAQSDVRLTFEGNLVGDLLFEMQGQVGALPLLQFTLEQLFQHRSGHRLTLQAYREIGGVEGALSQHAENTYTNLPSEEHRKLARALFLRLIEPGITEQDTTRRRAALSEIVFEDAVQTRVMQETLDAFVAARLLSTNEAFKVKTVEVSHEAIIREWSLLATWLREARKDILLQQAVSKDVAEWEQRGKPRDRLYRGMQLKEAQAWARRNKPSEQEAAFLRTSAVQRTLSLISLIVIVLLLLSTTGTVGWYLFFQPKPTLVTNLQDEGVGSLRWCVNNAPSGSTITFASDISGTIKLTGDLNFTGGKHLIIRGPGANRLTISGLAGAQVHVFQRATVDIADLSFKNSRTVTEAFVLNEGILSVTNSTISHNETQSGLTSFGGGIHNYPTGALTITSSTISDNSASGDRSGLGGGIYNEGELSISSSTLSHNSASQNQGDQGSSGGGIVNAETGTLTITSSTIAYNAVNGKQHAQGGGINNNGKLTITNVTLSHNSSMSDQNGLAGGIGNTKTGTLTITSSTISYNTVSGKQYGQGGGIGNEGKLTITNSTLSHNSAMSDQNGLGGGIVNAETGTLTITSSTIAYNAVNGKQYGQGGGINNEGKLTIINGTLFHNQVSGNQNSLGGGIFNNEGSSTMFRFCTIYDNSAKTSGGIWASPTDGHTMKISSSIIASNDANDDPDISGSLTSGGYNLIQNLTGVRGLNTTTDKQINIANLKIDAELRNHGSPVLLLALLPGSPAIDAIPLDACRVTIEDALGHTMTITTDQRSVKRPQGPQCDIGAFEYIPSG